MSDFLTPGVYRQDVRPVPAPLLRTAVPAFIGRARRQRPEHIEVGVPYRVLLRRDYDERIAPAADPGGYLTDAVRGFLAAGGGVCDVVLLDPDVGALPATGQALGSLAERDDVDLICLPDLFASPNWPSAADGQDAAEQAMRDVLAVQRAVLDDCRGRGDRFAILDAVPSQDPQVVVRQRTGLAGPAGSFGALYHPWVRVGSSGPAPRFVPPSGHVAGVYARTDRAVGVHKAPAGEPIEDLLDLLADLSPAELEVLSAAGVNCLRSAPGRGIRVWGARTVSDDPAWRDVTVRRLIGTIGRWLELFMAGLVHQPNDIRLWVRVMREVTAHLERLYLLGALKGRTAAEAFYVKCDDETNPPELRRSGIVVTQIGVAPTVPAEFIVVRVVQGTDGITVDAA